MRKEASPAFSTFTESMNHQNAIVEEYRKRTRKSFAAFRRAERYLPGGVSRSSGFFEPYPIYVSRGRGARIWDIDGNEIIDFLNNFSSLIHGHANRDIARAISKALRKGTAFGAPTESEYKLANMVRRRMPSIEKIRFCISGSEATLFSILVARAYTRKSKIVKFEGGFHGLHESVMIGSVPNQSGHSTSPNLDSIGVSPFVKKGTLVARYNDLGSTEKLLKAHKEDVAAVIIEPVMGRGGIVPAHRDFLHGLREVCSKLGIVLIFDEIFTGFRLAPGGAQEKYGIQSDLTALGKNLGGGMPIGGFGGTKEIMKMVDPFLGSVVFHSGTYTANPLSLEAGIECLSKLDRPTYQRLDRLAEEIEEATSTISNDYRLPVSVSRAGSLFNFSVQSEGRDSGLLKYSFFLSMLNAGVLLGTRGFGCISTPMGPSEIRAFSLALDQSLFNTKKAINANSRVRIRS